MNARIEAILADLAREDCPECHGEGWIDVGRGDAVQQVACACIDPMLLREDREDE